MSTGKVWLIARVNYLLGLRSHTFLMLTFGLPILIIASAVIVSLQVSTGPVPTVGYVDESGLLSKVSEIQLDGGLLSLQAFPDVAAAQAAQKAKVVDAYVVIPARYLDGEAVRYYGRDVPNRDTESTLEKFMQQALLLGTPATTLDLFDRPLQNLTFEATDSGSKARDGLALTLRFLFPFALSAVFGLLVMTNASQMGAAVVREKEQRAMEIVLTSVPIWQLISGKVLAVALLSLTQIAVWAAGGAIGLAIAIIYWAPNESIQIPFEILGWALALFIPGYFLYAVLAAGLGILAGNVRQAQQAAGAFGIFAMSPFFLLPTVMNAPNGFWAVALSVFPLTAPMITIMRMGSTTVPVQELLLTVAITILALAGSLWLITRVFRVAMLVYGQPLRPRAILRAVQGGHRRQAAGGSQ